MTDEEKQARLLSAWLEGNSEQTPEGLDDDVVEAIGVLRPGLAAPPNIDIDGLFDEVMGTSADATPGQTAAAAPPLQPEATDVVPQQANTNRWWMLGGTGLVVAATALFAVSVALNAPDGSFEGDLSKQTPASAPTMADNRAAVEEAPEAEADAADDDDDSVLAGLGKEQAPQEQAIEAKLASADGAAAEGDAGPMLQTISGTKTTETASTTSRPPPAKSAPKPAARATATRSASDSSGASAPNLVVQGVLADRRTAVAVCYNDAAGRDPMLSGAIVVEWGVVGGRTAYARAVSDSTGDAQLQRCLVDLIRGLTWPDGADGEWRERWAFSPVGEDTKSRSMQMLDDVMLESAEDAE